MPQSVGSPHWPLLTGSSQSPLPPWTLVLSLEVAGLSPPCISHHPLSPWWSYLVILSTLRWTSRILDSPQNIYTVAYLHLTWLYSHANSVLTVSSCSVWGFSTFSLQWLPHHSLSSPWMAPSSKRSRLHPESFLPFPLGPTHRKFCYPYLCNLPESTPSPQHSSPLLLLPEPSQLLLCLLPL